MVLSQIGSNFLKRNVLRNLCRAIHNEGDYSKVLVPLLDRKIFKVHGKDSQEFLQGLVTNDMRHFDDGAKSIFAMFLNNKGRVLYDTIIYKWGINDDKYLIECDKVVYSPLLKHLNMFKLRRDIKFEDLNNVLSVWALLMVGEELPESFDDADSKVNVVKDPRISELGYRILTAPDIPASDLVHKIGLKHEEVRLGDDEIYKYMRYRLGVGEGPQDLPPGQCLPLEINCDYLHGVCFNKGCYMGQELTARVYHTGVIRKRFMPIRFKKVVDDYIEKDTPIKSMDGGVTLGKLKGFVHDHGLALLRIKEALESKELKIGDQTAEALKPKWWPLEATLGKEND